MTTQRISRITWTILIGTALLGCSRRPPEPVPPSPDQKWYRVEHFQVHTGITGDPPPILMSSEEAVRFFQEQFPAKWGQWQRYARNPREDRNWEASRLIPEARLTGFCETHVRIETIKGLPKESVRPSNPRERTARFVVPRTPAIDALFDVGSAVTKFTLTYKGIGQGSLLFFLKDDWLGGGGVSCVLGKPDAFNWYQLRGLAAYYFAKDDVNVFAIYNQVHFVSKGKPIWLMIREREQARKNEESCNESNENGE